jgi:hypothetical protein
VDVAGSGQVSELMRARRAKADWSNKSFKYECLWDGAWCCRARRIESPEEVEMVIHSPAANASTAIVTRELEKPG